MTTVIEQRLERLKEAFRAIPGRAILARITDQNKATIEDKNIAQLEQGTDSSGSAITPAYSALTKAIKQGQGRPTDRVTLNDTGAFYKGVKVNPMATGFELINSDNKWGKLSDKYGEEIIGLSQESIEQLREEVYYPEVKRELINYFDTVNV